MRSARRTANGASPSITGMMGCSPGIRLKPSACMRSAKVAGVGVQPIAQAAMSSSSRSSTRMRGGGHRRSDAVRKQVRPRTLAQPGDDLLARGHKAAAGAAQCLAQSAGQDVDAADDAAQFVRAAAARADEAGRMRIIDHDQRTVANRPDRRFRSAARSIRPWKTRRRSRSGARAQSCESFRACSSSFMSLLA